MGEEGRLREPTGRRKAVPHQGLTESPENGGGVEGEAPDGRLLQGWRETGRGAVTEDRKE